MNFMDTKNVLKSPQNSLLPVGNVIKNPIIKAIKQAQQITGEANQFYQDKRDEIKIEAKRRYEKTYLAAKENALLEMQTNLLQSRELREQTLDKIETEILDLSLKIAKKIIGKEITQKPETILEIISTALQNTRNQEKITILVNPQNLEIIVSQSKKMNPIGRIKYFDFVGDSRVETEGCIIESEIGTVDARLETQLRILEKLLKNQS